MNRYKKRGWYGDSHRHYLAAKGIKTKKIPIKIKKPAKGTKYPISPKEVEQILAHQPDDALKGLKGIEFDNPKGEQKNAWAQYIRSRKAIKIFSQPEENGRLDNRCPVAVNRHMKEYVLPHEIGHHRALRGGKTDRSLMMAEKRADANVYGMDPFDADVQYL